jgi:hypothetical protein
MTSQANNVAIESSQINSSGVLQPAGGGTGTASTPTSGAIPFGTGTALTYNSSFTYNSSTGALGANSFVYPSTSNGLGITSAGLLNSTLYGFPIGIQPLSFTPTGKTKVAFTTSNSDQSWVVPSGITYIIVKCWGSGGGSGARGGWYSTGSGGGGGFSRGIIPVTAGETLTIRVGHGGYCPNALLNTGVVPTFATSYPYGGGSSLSGPDSNGYYGGFGGGYCAIFRSTTPLMIAGAGGGGGSNQNFYCGGPNGGAGGGTYGLRGDTQYNYASGSYAEGGTQSAGGIQAAGYYAGTGGAGSYLVGGSVQGYQYGGGGGGGYYGGGSGNYIASGTIMMAGGGGSGYVGPTVIFGQTFAGKGRIPAGMDDSDYPSSTASTYTSIGFGGYQEYAHGGDGYLVIYY